MAYFARVKEDNVVDLVVAVPDEFEADNTEYIANYWGEGGNWIQASFTARIRGVFPQPGYTYDPVADVFVYGDPLPEPTPVIEEEPVTEVTE